MNQIEMKFYTKQVFIVHTKYSSIHLLPNRMLQILLELIWIFNIKDKSKF